MIFRSLVKKTMIRGTTISALFIVLFLPLVGFAQTPPNCPSGTYCALSTVPGFTTATQAADPSQILKNIYGISIAVGAILAIGMIIWAGIQYATTEAISGKSEAKQHWQGAIFGLLLLLSSYLILRTIDIRLVSQEVRVNTTTPQTQVGGGGSSGILNQLTADTPRLTRTLTELGTAISEKQMALDQAINAGETSYDQAKVDRLTSELTALKQQQSGAAINLSKNGTLTYVVNTVEQQYASFSQAAQRGDLSTMRALSTAFQTASTETANSIAGLGTTNRPNFSQTEVDRIKNQLNAQMTYMNTYIQYVQGGSRGTAPVRPTFDPRLPTTSQ